MALPPAARASLATRQSLGGVAYAWPVRQRLAIAADKPPLTYQRAWSSNEISQLANRWVSPYPFAASLSFGRAHRRRREAPKSRGPSFRSRGQASNPPAKLAGQRRNLSGNGGSLRSRR